MIFVTDKGQLCNNIIQYGHLYAWGREHHRPTMSMRFAHKYPEFHISHTRWHSHAVYLAAKLSARMGLMPTVSFTDMGSDYAAEQRVMLSRPWVMAEGWCVRFFDLFDKYRADIERLFAFSPHVEQTVARRLQEAAAGGAKTAGTERPGGEGPLRLGLHIRRGDYATWCHGHYFYSDGQYAGVAGRFARLFPGRRVELFVCTNDRQTDRDLYRRRFGTEHVHFPDGSAAEDLCLLSHCHYLIGAPSTFTLVASMYHNARLHWITDPSQPLTPGDFDTFQNRHRQFDSLYIP